MSRSAIPAPALARLAIEPRDPLAGKLPVPVPGSKSITNRALLLAALAEGASELVGGLESDDTVVMRGALAALGIDVAIDGSTWRVAGRGGRFALPTHPLDCGNSGTTARFLTAALTLAPGPVVVDGNARMRERPISDLVSALRALGAGVEFEGGSECPPVRILGGGLPGGPARIDGRRSSQYVSAVLQAAPYATRDVELSFVDGVIVSRPYIELTLDVMRSFGARVEWRGTATDERIWVEAGRRYQASRYAIEPDASSAAYPFCAAAIAGGRATVAGVPAHSLQADFKILGLLERMGCRIEREGDRVTVVGPGAGGAISTNTTSTPSTTTASGARLRSLGEIDMNDFPDAVLAYAVVCLFADGPTTIRNVANLRIKETDRLAALETELRKLGAGAVAGPDWLRIEPAPLHGAEIATYDDHRMAMAFALAGLRVPGVVILDPGCVSKTWPGYFEAFSGL